MAAQLSAKLNLDVTGYKQGVDEAKKATEGYRTELGDLSKKFPSMRKELGQTKRAILDMENAWRSMSDAQKSSFEGQQLYQQLTKLKERGSELVDTMGDVSAELRNMASDTRALDVAKQGFDVLGNSVSLAANAYAAFTGDNEDAKRALTIFASVQSTVNTLTGLQNALQKQSSLMLAITTAQQKLKTKAIEMDTAAQGKNIVATKGATAAQWAMNLAADANPYVLLASAIIALVGAYAMFSDEINRAIGITNNLTKTQNEVREEMKNLSGQLADTIITTKKLSTEWKELKTEADKKQWIEDNQQAFKDLGIEIINTADAENVFVKNTDKFLEAQHIKMEALAYEAVAHKKLQEAIENGLDAEVDPNMFQKWWANAKDSWSKVTSGDTQQISDAIIKNSGWGALYNTFSDKGAEKFRKQALAEQDENNKLADKLMKMGAEKHKEYQQKLDAINVKEAKSGKEDKKDKKTTTKTTKEVEIKPDLTKLEDELKELEKKKLFAKTPKEVDDITKQIEQKKKEIENEKIRLKIKPDLSQLKDELEALKNVRMFAKTQEEVDEITELIKNKEKEIENEEIRLKIKVDPDIVQLNETKKKIEEILSGIEIKGDDKLKGVFDGLSDSAKEEANKVYEEYGRVYDARQQLQKLIDDTSLNESSIEEAQNALDELSQKYEDLTQKVIEYNSTAAQQKQFAEETKRVEEEQKKTLDDMGSAVQSVGSMFSSLSQIADDESINIAGIVMEAVANIALSFAKAMKDHKSFTVWDWIAAGAAGLAQMTAMIAAIKQQTKGYANGGIITGPYSTGDRMLARVNAHEMILNNRQQSNLFNAIDQNKLGTNNGQSSLTLQSVKVRGADLYLTMKNYENMTGKKL